MHELNLDGRSGEQRNQQTAVFLAGGDMNAALASDSAGFDSAKVCVQVCGKNAVNAL